jgi:enoyl-CoA hydratase
MARGPAAESRSPITLRRDGGLSLLTIDHPPLNLFDASVFDSLEKAVDELSEAPPRALLVRAEGEMVSAGADVGLFQGLSAADATALWIRLVGIVRKLEALPLPTVFSAHSLTLTASFELALACDLLVAADSARFGLVEKVVGLTPGMGGVQRLAERAGPARAKELVMTGELFDAQTLHSWGVVNRVWAETEVAERSLKLARGLADGPTLAHAATKRVVAAQVESGLAGADLAMAEVSGALFATEDARGAFESFLAEGPGKAQFNGR